MKENCWLCSDILFLSICILLSKIEKIFILLWIFQLAEIQDFILDASVDLVKKFFVACIITGLEYLHTNGILHRDIKPENLVLDTRGYLRITDLGIARDTSGTPGYMAPEVMCRQNHGVAADYFAVGVIGYEFMTGRVIFKFRDLIKVKVEKKQEIKFQLDKYSLNDMRYQKDGLWKQLISQIKESRLIDQDQTVHKKSNHIFELKITLGKSSWKKQQSRYLYRIKKKIILTLDKFNKILGRIRTKNYQSKILFYSEEILSKHFLMDIIMM